MSDINHQAFAEEDCISISMIQHLLFCKRRASLILLEDAWQENLHTVVGSQFHENVDQPRNSYDGSTGIVTLRSLRVRSLVLGLTGIVDVIELHPTETDKKPVSRIRYPLSRDQLQNFTLFPLEFKKGRKRKEIGYMLQLCAQALCLEEMLKVRIPEGAIFFGKSRRRLSVVFDEELRSKTQIAALRLHEIFQKRLMHPPEYNEKCHQCSLFELCNPVALSKSDSVNDYLNKTIKGVKTK